MTSIITPTRPQYDYITSTARFPAMVAGFGAGKTESAIKRAILGKLTHPEVNRGFYEPTYDLIRQIAFPRFEEALEAMGIPYRLYKTPKNEIDFGEGMGKIIFRSMDNPGRIIGYEHGDADIDELDTLKEIDANEVWQRVMSRNRQRKAGNVPNTIGVTTTPEGFKFVYKNWGKGKLKDGYELIKASTRSNIHLGDDYIQNLLDTYPAELIKAYMEGDFVNLTAGTVFNCYNTEVDKTGAFVGSNDTDVVEKPKESLKIGMDFNVTNMSAVVYVVRKGTWYAVNEFLGVYDTPSMIETLQEEYPEHNITVYPDASGNARKTVNASISDHSLLKAAGFRLKHNPKNPFIKDRILASNAGFSKRKVLVNAERCPEYSACLAQLAYDKNGQPDKTSGLDHLPDAGTYPLAYEMPIRKPVSAIPVRF